MFDFTWTDHTFGNVLYCIAIYGLFIILYYRRYVTNAFIQSSKPDTTLIIAALLLIITACIDGDWFNYGEMVRDYDFSPGANNYGEPVYYYIISLVNKNYLLFRIIVWGLAFWLTYLTFKRFEINLNVALFFLIAVFVVKFNYARATLAMASYFLGLSYLLKPRKGSTLMNLLLIFLFFWGAFEFHHSTLLLIMFTVTAFLPFDKPVVIIVLVINLPLLAALLKDNLIMVDQLENEYLSNKLNRYLEVEKGKANIYGMISSVISYGVFFIPVIFDSIAIYKNVRKVNKKTMELFRIALSVFIFSLSFFFMGLDSTVFVYRIMYMSFIPLTIVTVNLFESHMINKKQYCFIVLWGIFTVLIKLFTLFLGYK